MSASPQTIEITLSNKTETFCEGTTPLEAIRRLLPALSQSAPVRDVRRATALR